MAERERRGEERSGRTRGRAARWLLVLLVLVVLAVIAFFALGGSADVDSEGDLQLPDVDVDVNAPSVDISTEDAPEADADAGG